MSALAAALIVGGAAKVASGIASGVGTAQAAKKMMLTDAEQRELDELEARKRRGELGLTEKKRGALEQQFLAEQAGANRELEAGALQQAAARGLSGASSGRDVFLQEQAQATAKMGMRQNQNLAVAAADEAQAAADAARIDSMNAQQKQAEAMKAQGIAQAVSGGLAGAGDTASSAASMMQQTKMAEIEAAARAEDTASILNRYNDAPGSYNFSFGATA